MTSTQPRYKDIIKQIEELQKQADKLKAEERSKVLERGPRADRVFEFTAGELGLKAKLRSLDKKVPIRYTDDNGIPGPAADIGPGG